MALVVAAALSGTAPVSQLNLAVSAALAPVGRAVPALQLVWVLGGLPLTTAVLLWATLLRPRRRAEAAWIWGAFVLGGLVELGCKHWIALPAPRTVPEPAVLASLEPLLNVGPQDLSAFWHMIHPGVAQSIGHWLRGSFPSGHVFRLTYTVGRLGGRRRVAGVAALVSVVAAFAVVATGGHWCWDALGGGVLAGLCLQLPPAD